ncbi:hypothetical protein B0H17DRAFT_1202730 [Mycena rosella]|uniref:Uncharacterized protein n=1 Tax=Mycena rosella TaxID=1033263 RepID=A0AAD7DD74_MYCRO|nr:hypothetical protein B0H17DRAFT_1202730 [Mycena rosella]
MQLFTFDSPKILKSAVYREDGDDRSLQYTIATTKQTFARQRTTVRDGAVAAEIDWRERTFEIAGERHGVDGLKRKVSNFSETRYWKWLNGRGEEYKVKYFNADETWTVKASTGEIVAEFTSQLGRGKLPVLRMVEDQDDIERWFLLLVLLYSETKRLDRED